LDCVICKKELKEKIVIVDVTGEEHEVCDHHPVPDDMKKEVE